MVKLSFMNIFFPMCHQVYKSALCKAEPHSSVGSVLDLRTGSRWFDPPAQPIFFPRTDDSHCDRIHFSLITVHCFDNGYLGKQPVAWKEYCAEYWLKRTPGKHG